MRLRSSSIAVLALVTVAVARTGAQAPLERLKITKIDPPNWYAQLPKPMLLVRGEGLSGARFTLSDASLHIERTELSANGHWAFLWLTASPTRPESILIRATAGAQRAEAPYAFAARRAANDGLAGFSSRDVMHLIMTDRFADGDLTNDGPLAQSNADSADAAAEHAKPRGWHGGDLRGITQHLDYLQQLGVTTVWPTPVYQNIGPEAYHGYHCTDYYSVDKHYGSMTDLQMLASSLHKRGMKLVLDTVPNHVGPFHPWIHDEPTPDWFHGTLAHHVAGETHFRSLVDPHAPERDRVTTLSGWFVDLLPDMNTDNPAVAQYLRQNAVWWLEQTGADGLRIDTFPYVDRPFWQAFNGELAELYPHVTAVGEISDGSPQVTSFFAGGVSHGGVDTRLYTPFDFPIYHAAHDVFAKGEPLSRLAEVLASDSLYPHPERLVTFLGNHDTTRFAEDVQSPALRKLAFAFLRTTRGTPQIYSGDEIAMRGGDDPDDRRDFPGGFRSGEGDAFSRAGRTAEQQEGFAWTAQLSGLRREHPSLACGGEQVLSSASDWLVYVRDSSHTAEVECGPRLDRTIVAIHRGAKPDSVSLSLEDTWLSGCSSLRTELSTGQVSATREERTLKIDFKGNDLIVLTCK